MLIICVVLQVQAVNGMEMRSFDDTMLLSFVLYAGVVETHTLEDMALKHLKQARISLRDIAISKRTKPKLEHMAPKAVLQYCAQSVDFAVRLHAILKPDLVRKGVVNTYETTERPLVQVLASMEQHGIKVCVEHVRKYGAA